MIDKNIGECEYAIQTSDQDAILNKLNMKEDKDKAKDSNDDSNNKGHKDVGEKDAEDHQPDDNGRALVENEGKGKSNDNESEDKKNNGEHNIQQNEFYKLDKCM